MNTEREYELKQESGCFGSNPELDVLAAPCARPAKGRLERGWWGEGALLFPPGGGDISPSSDSVHSASWDWSPQPPCRLRQKRRLLPSLPHKPLSIPAVPLATSLRFQKGHPLSSVPYITTAPPWSPWRAQRPTQVRGPSQPPSSKSNPPEAPHRGEEKIVLRGVISDASSPSGLLVPWSSVMFPSRACTLAVLSAWNVLPGILRNGSRASAPMLPLRDALPDPRYSAQSPPPHAFLSSWHSLLSGTILCLLWADCLSSQRCLPEIFCSVLTPGSPGPRTGLCT